MEILCEYTIPAYSPIGLILVGVVIISAILGIILCFVDYFDEHDGSMLTWGILLIGLLGLVILGTIGMCQDTTTYTIARVPDTVSYQDIVEQWNYVSHEGDIYKLIAR